MWRSRIVIAMLWLSGAPALAQPISDVEGVFDYPLNHPADIGTGWNWARGSAILGTCLKVPRLAENIGVVERLNFTRVTDETSILRALSVNASAKVMYAAGRAKGSVNFARQVKKTGYHETIVATATVSSKRRYLSASGASPNGQAAPIDLGDTVFLPLKIEPASASLTDKWADLKAAQIPSFRQDCGDGFVSAITLGGNISILYDFTVKTESDRTEISANVSGSYANFSGNASLNRTLDKFSRNGQLKISYSKSGGGGRPIPITLAALRGELSNFSRSVGRAPIAMSLTITPYEQIPGWPMQINSSRQETVDKIIEAMLRFHFIEQQALEIFAHQDAFVFGSGVNTVDVKAVAAKAGDSKNILMSALNACTANQICAFPQQNIPRDDYDLRSYLPIGKESSAIYLEISAAEAELSNLGIKLSQLPAQLTRTDVIYAPGGFPGIRIRVGTNRRTFANPEIARINQAIIRVTARLARARVNWEKKLVDEQLNAWVISPSMARCAEGIDTLCLSPTRIEEYRARLIARQGA